MVWGDGAAQRNYITDVMTRTHHDIETMTRRLELEKRRLKRIEKELEAAQRTYSVRVHGVEGTRSARQNVQSARDTQQSVEADLKSERSKEFSKEYVASESLTAVTAGGSSASTALAAPVKALLNRLDVHQKKLDSMNHENQTLRDEVDGIRRRRLQLNAIFERLSIEIQNRTGQLADFVEETASSKAVNGDANQRIGVMKRQRELERRQFKQEVTRLRADLKDVEVERRETEVMLKRADMGTQRKGQNDKDRDAPSVQKKKELIVPEEEKDFDEGDMMRRIMKTAFLNCIQRRHIKQHQKNIEVYEQAFSTIKQSTGIEHIEEIVKIFVNLESRNFSLLTYVNVMNREIEALEGVRRERQQAEETRKQFEKRQEQVRKGALSDGQRQLEAATNAIDEGHEAVHVLQDVVDGLMPIVKEITGRIEKEFEMLRASATASTEDMIKIPGELRLETLPEWLEMVEHALGHFRDLMPSNTDKEGAFPCTAGVSVKNLPPKRVGGQLGQGQQTLVKKEELPSALGIATDEPRKAQLTAAQKAELLDEVSDEEDLDGRPLRVKDIKELIKKKHENRLKRRAGGHRGAIGAPATPASARGGRGSMTSPGPGSSVSPSPVISPRSSQVHGSRSNRKSAETAEKYDEASDGADQQEPIEGSHSRALAMEEIGPASNADGASTLGDKIRAGESTGTDVTEEEIEKVFLQRYRMTREELQVMADHMQIHVHNLCFLKQEFDQYDQDQSGYIDLRELKSLLKKLGEDLGDEALDAAFKQLDADGSGEIEFFEFCEWFTSTDS
jgi:hypothetical protein